MPSGIAIDPLVSPTSTMTNDTDENVTDHAASSTTGTGTSSLPLKGVAGRINYAAWDKVATDLVQQTELEDAEETATETRKVCLDYTCLTTTTRRMNDALLATGSETTTGNASLE